MKRSNRAVIITSIVGIAILAAACEDAAGFIHTAYEGATDIIADMPPATPTEVPPFVITKPIFEISGRTNYFNYAGIVFKFLNHAEEHIDRITISFMLFDPKTQSNPFITANKFEITKWDFVLPKENKEIIISLDQYIYIAPAEPYIIDFFYISEIHYLNGSVWQDKNGKYRIRGTK
jgi:hypothetical protein